MATRPPPALLITGHVLDAHGRPVAGARLDWVEAPVALPDQALLSGPDGRFTLAVPAAGRYRLRATSDAHGQAEAALDARPGTLTLQLRLPR